MKKQVQIPMLLFINLLLIIQDLKNEHEIDFERICEIENQLMEKFDKLITREIFSRYKTAPTGTEREVARKEYLKKIGIHKDWISENEI